MKPTICLKIFSFSVGDIMSTAVNFICNKISLELFISVKHNWIWKQKSNIGVILKGDPESCEFASCKSMSWEPMSLRVASLRAAKQIENFKLQVYQFASCVL